LRPVAVLAAATYLVMVSVNVLANTLPINGVRTGDVSDSYPSLITPAGYAFSIWSLIYLLLALHVLYQLGLFRADPPSSDRTALLRTVAISFSISSVANTAWVFAWHYDVIWLSVLLIVAILVCLAVISRAVASANLTMREWAFVGVPFGVYFGWTTVATVANITVFLVSLDWDGFGLDESTWAVIVLIATMTIGTTTMLRNRDLAYGAVLVWAYTAILVRQLSTNGYDGGYPRIVTTVILCLAVFVVAAAAILVRRRSSSLKQPRLS
jgi:hypothetical protein